MVALPSSPLSLLDPERAHGLALTALRWRGRIGRAVPVTSPRLASTVAGIAFPNPLGLAAGADKDGVAVAGWFALGLGAVELGTLTPRPQPGNPRPRLFRLTEDRAVVNRMGFNNGGLDDGLARIGAARKAGVVGISVGANKEAADRVAD